VEELLRHGNEIISETFKTMEIYLLVGAIYYVMSLIAAHAILGLENYLRPTYLNLP
jgi:polar amino acid transport system permease protein